MKKILLLVLLFISLQTFAQVKEKLNGKWIARTENKKEKKTIEFQFDKDGSHIIISHKKKGSSSSNKNLVSVFEETSTIVYMALDTNFKLNTHTYAFAFLSDDVLELKNKDDVNDIITLDRKK